MFAIRWLGAFGRGNSLADSLQWELSRSDREVAAEWFAPDASFRGLNHAYVGVLVDKGAVIKRFKGDVWSVIEGNRLVATRPSRESTGHCECFCLPRYRGIVLREVRGGIDNVKPSIRRPVLRAADQYGLPIYSLEENGDLRAIYGGDHSIKRVKNPRY